MGVSSSPSTRRKSLERPPSPPLRPVRSDWLHHQPPRALQIASTVATTNQIEVFKLFRRNVVHPAAVTARYILVAVLSLTLSFITFTKLHRKHFRRKNSYSLQMFSS